MKEYQKWCCINDNFGSEAEPYILEESMKYKRTDSIAWFINGTSKTWRHWKTIGWKCVKVKVSISILTTLFITLALAGCKEMTTKQYFNKLLKPDTPKVIEKSKTAAIDTSMNATLRYIEVMGQFRKISDELKEYELLYYKTDDDRYRVKYNKLLPKYHKLGRLYKQELNKLKSRVK